MFNTLSSSSVQHNSGFIKTVRTKVTNEKSKSYKENERNKDKRKGTYDKRKVFEE